MAAAGARLRALRPDQLAATAVSLARLGAQPDADFASALAAASGAVLQAFDVQGLLNLLWAFHTWHLAPPAAWQYAAVRALQAAAAAESGARAPLGADAVGALLASAGLRGVLSGALEAAVAVDSAAGCGGAAMSCDGAGDLGFQLPLGAE